MPSPMSLTLRHALPHSSTTAVYTYEVTNRNKRTHRQTDRQTVNIQGGPKQQAIAL